MFGTYELDVQIEEGDIQLVVEAQKKRYRYYRRLGNDEVEKIIHTSKAKLIVCPVEPVNIPDVDVSEHLLVELVKPVVVASGMNDSFFLKFPIEIGVFLVDKKDVERIDIFTKTKPKFTLYGPPEKGIVCKWWSSDLYREEPQVDQLFEGIMRVDIKNNYYEWMELHKVVFRAFDMNIYYNKHAYMHAYLTIQKRILGETAFNTRKPPNMHRGVDIYQAKGLKKLEKKYLMDWGFK